MRRHKPRYMTDAVIAFIEPMAGSHTWAAQEMPALPAAIPAGSPVQLPLQGLQNTMNLPAIRSAACAEFKCSPVDFASPRRFREAVDARHAAMWVVRTETGMSFPAIARVFGGIDHTSVMHAVSRIEHRIEHDQEFADRVARVAAQFQGMPRA